MGVCVSRDTSLRHPYIAMTHRFHYFRIRGFNMWDSLSRTHITNFRGFYRSLNNIHSFIQTSTCMLSYVGGMWWARLRRGATWDLTFTLLLSGGMYSFDYFAIKIIKNSSAHIYCHIHLYYHF